MQTMTVFDMILAGGCLGMVALGTALLGLIVSIVALGLAGRRVATLIPLVWSAFPVSFGAVGTFYSLALMRAAQERAAAGEEAPMTAGEIADWTTLSWSTTVIGAVGSGLLLAIALLALLVKRPEPAPGDED
jgi:hypothetical protein